MKESAKNSPAMRSQPSAIRGAAAQANTLSTPKGVMRQAWMIPNQLATAPASAQPAACFACLSTSFATAAVMMREVKMKPRSRVIIPSR